MIQWIGTVVAALLTLGALCSPSIAWAKPADLPGAVQQQCPEGRDGQQAEGFRTRPSDPASQTSTPTPNDLQARHLFEIAERCRARGDHDKARTCYEEVHLLSPTSPHGRLAMHRLWELDRARLRNHADTAEEQEAPPERELYREPTERRRELNTKPTSRRLRETIRPVDDDARHKEMLRSTQPLETQPERSQEEDDALRTIQYYEAPPAAFTRPPSEKPRRMPRADEDTNSEPKAQSPRSWTPGFDFTLSRAALMSGQTEYERPDVENMKFPWNGWRARLIQGLVWYDWPRACLIKQTRPETHVRGFVDFESAATQFLPPTFIGGQEAVDFTNMIRQQQAFIPAGAFVNPDQTALEFFQDRFVVASMGLVAPIGPALSAGYLPPTWVFSKQPILFLVYPFEPGSPEELTPTTPPGTPGNFDLIPHPHF